MKLFYMIQEGLNQNDVSMAIWQRKSSLLQTRALGPCSAGDCLATLLFACFQSTTPSGASDEELKPDMIMSSRWNQACAANCGNHRVSQCYNQCPRCTVSKSLWLDKYHSVAPWSRWQFCSCSWSPAWLDGGFGCLNYKYCTYTFILLKSFHTI